MAGTKDFLLLKYYNSLQSLLPAAGALRRSYTYSKDTAQDATHILLRDSAIKRTTCEAKFSCIFKNLINF